MSPLQDYIPLVSILCNPGIRTRHWDQMSEIVGYDLTPNSGSTLRKVLKQNLTPYLESFEQISAAASKVRYDLLHLIIIIDLILDFKVYLQLLIGSHCKEIISI